MTKLEAIIHLYAAGYIDENKAFQLADSRGLSDEEKEQLRNEIHRIKNPPVEDIPEGSIDDITDPPVEDPIEETPEDTDDESTQDIPIE